MNGRLPRIAGGLWLLALPPLLLPTALPGATVGALVLLLIVLGLIVYQARPWPARTFNPFLLIFLAWMLGAFLISPLPALSLPKLLVIASGAVGLGLVQLNVRREADATRLALGLVVVGALTAGAALFALSWPAGRLLPLGPIVRRIPHLTGSFFAHHNEVAALTVVLLPGALLLGRRGQPGWPRRLANGAALLLGGVLILTQSRNGLASLAVVAVVAWLAPRLRPRTVVLALLLVALASALLPDTLSRGRLSAALAALDAGTTSTASVDAGWGTRLEIWQAAQAMGRDYPVTGTGLYTFDPISRLNYPYELVGPGLPLSHAHNLWLDSVATLGWPGWLMLVLFWAVLLGTVWPLVRNGDVTARVFALGLIGYLAFNLVDMLHLGQKPGLVVWLLIAGAVALTADPTGGERTQAVAHRPTLSALAALPVLLLSLLALSPALARNQAHRALDRRQLHLANAAVTPTALTDARRQGLLAWLADDPEAALIAWRADPEAARFLESRGRLATAAGRPQAAIDWYTAALAIDPARATSYFQRGIAYEIAGDRNRAFDDYGLAAAGIAGQAPGPVWEASVAYSYGNALLRRGAAVLAVAPLRQAATLRPDIAVYAERLGDALLATGDEAGAAAAYAAAARIQPAP